MNSLSKHLATFTTALGVFFALGIPTNSFAIEDGKELEKKAQKELSEKLKNLARAEKKRFK